MARAVARAAIDEGLAPAQSDDDLEVTIERYQWTPTY